VLNPRSKYPGDKHALASRRGMLVYASAIARSDKKLAQDIRHWVREEKMIDEELAKQDAEIQRKYRSILLKINNLANP
jgi:hypothetical protein